MKSAAIASVVTALVGATAVGAQTADAGSTATTKAATAAAAPYCGITWGSGDKAQAGLTTNSLVRVTTTRTAFTCYDRIVFELSGTARGYSVRYTAAVLTEGQGLNMSPYTAGGAHLFVVLNAPTSQRAVGSHAVNVLGYRTLRDATFGGSFEGYTTFDLGVRARLPFRVTRAAGRITIDVAHQWTA